MAGNAERTYLMIKPDGVQRGLVGKIIERFETRGYKQDGTVVCTFRRKVMVPKRSYGDSRGGEQPGRPTPQV